MLKNITRLWQQRVKIRARNVGGVSVSSLLRGTKSCSAMALLFGVAKNFFEIT